jgi:hypothetical protein
LQEELLSASLRVLASPLEQRPPSQPQPGLPQVSRSLEAAHLPPARIPTATPR